MRSKLPMAMVVVVLAALLLSFSTAQAAPDYEAVEKRLADAVAAGELTSAQAEEMMRVLRKLGTDTFPAKAGDEPGRHEASKKRITVEDILRADEEVNKALRARTLTAEEGRARLNAMRKRLRAQDVEDKISSWRRSYAKLEAELGELVSEGKMTEEERSEQLEAMRRVKPTESPGGDTEQDVQAAIAGYEAELEKAVKMGALTEDAAKRILEAYAKRLRARRSEGSSGAGGGDVEAQKVLQARMAKVRAAIDADVKAGRITREQGEVRWEAYLEDLRECSGEPLPR